MIRPNTNEDILGSCRSQLRLLAEKATDERRYFCTEKDDDQYGQDGNADQDEKVQRLHGQAFLLSIS